MVGDWVTRGSRRGDTFQGTCGSSFTPRPSSLLVWRENSRRYEQRRRETRKKERKKGKGLVERKRERERRKSREREQEKRMEEKGRAREKESEKEGEFIVANGVGCDKTAELDRLLLQSASLLTISFKVFYGRIPFNSRKKPSNHLSKLV